MHFRDIRAVIEIRLLPTRTHIHTQTNTYAQIHRQTHTHTQTRILKSPFLRAFDVALSEIYYMWRWFCLAVRWTGACVVSGVLNMHLVGCSHSHEVVRYVLAYLSKFSHICEHISDLVHLLLCNGREIVSRRYTPYNATYSKIIMRTRLGSICISLRV